ncbi:component of SCAR regulatory complex [Pelomyxa schiedti]|nr:component of SCAR regulatory complex [Pelomyxa schiedti]
MVDTGSSGVEKMQDLKREWHNVMKRLYLCKLSMASPKLKPKVLQDRQYEKVTQKLLSRFPDFPEGADKIPGYDLLSTKAKTHLEEFEPLYFALADACNWKTTTMGVLVDMSSALLLLKIDENPMLMTLWMDLMVNFVQLTILAWNIPDKKNIVGVFAKLYYHVNGFPEPSFAKVSKWVLDLENPISKLFGDFKAVSTTIGAALNELKQAFSASRNLMDLRKNEALNISLKPGKMTEPVQDQLRFDLQVTENMHNWIIYGYLVCPQTLTQTNAVPLLTEALTEAFVLPVYYDVTFQPHSEFDSILSSTVKDKTLKSLYAKHKRMPRDTQSQSGQTALGQHRSRRVFLMQELTALFNLTLDSPALLSPKLQVIIAALSMAKAEIEWYFRHYVAPPPPKAPKNYVDMFRDPRIPDLIQLVQSLKMHLGNNREEIAQYFVEFLAGADHKGFESLRSLWQGVAQPAVQVGDQILNALAAISPTSNFQQLRSLCTNMEYLLSLSSSPIALSKLREVTMCLRVIHAHARAIDSLDNIIEENSSLLSLWYFKDSLREVYETYISNPTMHGPRHTYIYLDMLSNFTKVATSAWPEERESIGPECVKMAVTFLEKQTRVLQNSLQAVLNYQLLLDSQFRDEVAAALFNLKRKDWRAPKDFIPPPEPGNESSYQNRDSLENIWTHLKVIMAITKAVSELPVVVVYDHQIAASEYVREMVKGTLLTWLRNTVKPTPDSIERPTILKKQISAVFYVLTLLEQRVMFGLQQIWQEILIEEVCPNEPPPLGTETPIPEVDMGDRIVGTLINWYVHFVTQRLYLPPNQNCTIVFSPTRMGFVSKPGQPFRAENYVDIEELQALASIIGPYGVRQLDAAIVRFLITNVQAVKDAVAAMASPLEEINSNFTKEARVAESIKRIKPLDIDSFVAKCIIIGNTLHFRVLLKEALLNTVTSVTPYIHSTVNNAFNQSAWRNVYLLPQLLGINSLAGDIGINVGSADQYFKLALKKVVSEADQKIVRLLPVAFAISIYSTQWKEAQYIPPLEAFQNSTHVLNRCYHDLLEAMNVVSMSTQDPVVVMQQMRHYLEVTTTLVLRLLRGDLRRGPADPPGLSLQSDKFLSVCSFLTRDILESCIPYALLRSMAHDLYRGEHRSPEGW